MENENKQQLGYSEAIAEVERILAGFNDGDVDIDKLAEQVKRAGELISLCKERLKKAEEDVAKVLAQNGEQKGA